MAACRGEFGDATELYEEAAEGFQEVDDVLGMAKAWVGTGTVERQLRRYDDAMERFARAEAVGEELGSVALVMECRLRKAQVGRRRGDVDTAARLYNDYLVWARRTRNVDATMFAEHGMGLLALARDDMHDLYDRTTSMSRILESMPGHWLWATYRLLVAAMLAHRGDEDGTYTWLWSATELGIADTVDEDTAYLLTDITAIGLRSDWRNVVRVAGKEAVHQLQRLEDIEGAKFVQTQMDRILLTH